MFCRIGRDDETSQIGKRLSHRRSRLSKNPPLVAVHRTLVLSAFGIDTIKQTLVERGPVIARFGFCESEEVNDEFRLMTLHKIAPDDVLSDHRRQSVCGITQTL